MGVTYRFIADPEQPSEVVGWFRSLRTPPTEVEKEHGVVLYFRDFGPLVYSEDKTVDAKRSPLVSIFLPQIKRGVFWTVGEVHFLATPLRRLFPKLHRVSSEFSEWLESHECVYSNKRANNDFDYYLEGSVRNFDPPIFAFDSGFKALKAGRYFVGSSDEGLMLEKICRTLRLKGIECAEAP